MIIYNIKVCLIFTVFHFTISFFQIKMMEELIYQLLLEYLELNDILCYRCVTKAWLGIATHCHIFKSYGIIIISLLLHIIIISLFFILSLSYFTSYYLTLLH